MKKPLFFIMMNLYYNIIVHSANESFNLKSNNYQFNVINALARVTLNYSHDLNKNFNQKTIQANYSPLTSNHSEKLKFLNGKLVSNITEACYSQFVTLTLAFQKRESWAVAGIYFFFKII